MEAYNHAQVCDECGEHIPNSEPSMVNAHHLDSCSLHPSNVTEHDEDADEARLFEAQEMYREHIAGGATSPDEREPYED